MLRERLLPRRERIAGEPAWTGGALSRVRDMRIRRGPAPGSVDNVNQDKARSGSFGNGGESSRGDGATGPEDRSTAVPRDNDASRGKLQDNDTSPEGTASRLLVAKRRRSGK
ncbi:MAG: hypothetical protein K6U74_14195 [Firmicutes bacterium]|nr:hypothetical protein [Bacillota bacterium]